MLLMASPIVVPTIVLTNTAHDEFKQAVRIACPDDSQFEFAQLATAQLMFTFQRKDAFVAAGAHNEPSF